MLVKTVGYRHCQLVKLQSKRVCIWTPVFHRIQQERLRLHIVPVNAAALAVRTGSFTRLFSAGVVIYFQNNANLSSALMFFNVLMVMAARAAPSAAESDFLCTHTQAVSMLEKIATQHQTNKNLNCCMCIPVLHKFQPSFR